jgi:hypothetical protein
VIAKLTPSLKLASSPKLKSIDALPSTTPEQAAALSNSVAVDFGVKLRKQTAKKIVINVILISSNPIKSIWGLVSSPMTTVTQVQHRTNNPHAGP